MVRLVRAPEQEKVWTCGCGSQYFALTRERGYCLNCGLDVSLPPPS